MFEPELLQKVGSIKSKKMSFIIFNKLAFSKNKDMIREQFG
jgi:hypothetical protein